MDRNIKTWQHQRLLLKKSECWTSYPFSLRSRSLDAANFIIPVQTRVEPHSQRTWMALHTLNMIWNVPVELQSAKTFWTLLNIWCSLFWNAGCQRKFSDQTVRWFLLSLASWLQCSPGQLNVVMYAGPLPAHWLTPPRAAHSCPTAPRCSFCSFLTKRIKKSIKLR